MGGGPRRRRCWGCRGVGRRRRGRHRYGCGGQDLHRLDRRPPHQPRTLLADPDAVHGGVGFVVAWGQPSPRGQLCGARGSGARPRSRPRTPRPAPARYRGSAGPRGSPGRVAGQPPARDLGEQLDLEVQRLDQPAQRGEESFADIERRSKNLATWIDTLIRRRRRRTGGPVTRDQPLRLRSRVWWWRFGLVPGRPGGIWRSRSPVRRPGRFAGRRWKDRV